METITQKNHLNRIFSRLFSVRPQSLAVIGDRQMGKSTLLGQICDPKIYRSYLPQGLNPLIRLYVIEAENADCQNLLSRICTDLAKATGFSLKTQDHYHELHELIKQYQESYYFYLIFDNFELLTQNPHIPLEFYSYLRSLANSYMIAYVTGSRASLQSLCVRQDICESPFFNIFTNLELKGFTEAETKELADLIAPQTDIGLCYQVCAGHPGLTVKWLQECRKGKPELQEFVNGNAEYLHDLLTQFDTETRSVLQCLAHGIVIAQPQRFIIETLRRKGYLASPDQIASAAIELYLQNLEQSRSKNLFQRLFRK